MGMESLKPSASSSWRHGIGSLTRMIIESENPGRGCEGEKYEKELVNFPATVGTSWRVALAVALLSKKDPAPTGIEPRLKTTVLSTMATLPWVDSVPSICNPETTRLERTKSGSGSGPVLNM